MSFYKHYSTHRGDLVPKSSPINFLPTAPNERVLNDRINKCTHNSKQIKAF